MKNLLLIIFCFTLAMFTSCEKSIYYDFSDEEKELFIYESGDIFSMLLYPGTDTIKFEIEQKKYRFSSSPSVITPQTNYYQMCEITFISGDDLTGGISGDLSDNGRLDMEIFIRLNGIDEFSGSLCDTLYSYNLNGQNYPELFVFASIKGKNPMLYFSKNKGIVYIDSTASGNSYSLIEYVKKSD